MPGGGPFGGGPIGGPPGGPLGPPGGGPCGPPGGGGPLGPPRGGPPCGGGPLGPPGPGGGGPPGGGFFGGSTTMSNSEGIFLRSPPPRGGEPTKYKHNVIEHGYKALSTGTRSP